MRRALLLAETCKFGNVEDAENVPQADWICHLEHTASIIAKMPEQSSIIKVRSRLYPLILNAVPSQLIFKVTTRNDFY